VVVENISRHMRMGKTRIQAALERHEADIRRDPRAARRR
jgi:hypothetical protein